MNDSELAEMEKNTSRKLPFWYWINGPLADALTHVGQITSWRRISGNPQLKGVNVFHLFTAKNGTFMYIHIYIYVIRILIRIIIIIIMT